MAWLLNLGAGASVWLGPAIVVCFLGIYGVQGVIWIFAALYALSGFLALFLTAHLLRACLPPLCGARLVRAKENKPNGFIVPLVGHTEAFLTPPCNNSELMAKHKIP